MVRALLLSIDLITVLYVLVNVAYLRGLGIAGMSGSDAVAAALMRATVGPVGASLLSLLVAAAARSSASATIFTRVRTSYALGGDLSLFALVLVFLLSDGGGRLAHGRILADRAKSKATAGSRPPPLRRRCRRLLHHSNPPHRSDLLR